MPAPGSSFLRLVEVMQRLLAPDGCPWDREQTLASLRSYLIEETYEVLDAIDGGDPAAHCEELGDLMFQIVFQAAIADGFDIDDVADGIADKLTRRHPHVFGDARYEDVDWNEMKREERGPRRTLDGVPRAMPALARAQRISERAAKVGFDWPDVAGCRAKVAEELAEIDRELASPTVDRERVADEIGDLLFAAVSLARKVDVDAESALRATIDKFESRFAFVEDELGARGSSPRASTLEEMDALWERAKRRS